MKIKFTYSLILLLLLPASFTAGRQTAKPQYHEDCIPISDFAGVTIDEADYPCFQLKDYGHVDDDPSQRSYAGIIREINGRNIPIAINYQFD